MAEPLAEYVNPFSKGTSGSLNPGQTHRFLNVIYKGTFELLWDKEENGNGFRLLKNNRKESHPGSGGKTQKYDTHWSLCRQQPMLSMCLEQS